MIKENFHEALEEKEPIENRSLYPQTTLPSAEYCVHSCIQNSRMIKSPQPYLEVVIKEAHVTPDQEPKGADRTVASSETESHHSVAPLKPSAVPQPYLEVAIKASEVSMDQDSKLSDKRLPSCNSLHSGCQLYATPSLSDTAVAHGPQAYLMPIKGLGSTTESQALEKTSTSSSKFNARVHSCRVRIVKTGSKHADKSSTKKKRPLFPKGGNTMPRNLKLKPHVENVSAVAAQPPSSRLNKALASEERKPITTTTTSDDSQSYTIVAVPSASKTSLPAQDKLQPFIIEHTSEEGGHQPQLYSTPVTPNRKAASTCQPYLVPVKTACNKEPERRNIERDKILPPTVSVEHAQSHVAASPATYLLLPKKSLLQHQIASPSENNKARGGNTAVPYCTPVSTGLIRSGSSQLPHLVPVKEGSNTKQSGHHQPSQSSSLKIPLLNFRSRSMEDLLGNDIIEDDKLVVRDDSAVVLKSKKAILPPHKLLPCNQKSETSKKPIPSEKETPKRSPILPKTKKMLMHNNIHRTSSSELLSFTQGSQHLASASPASGTSSQPNLLAHPYCTPEKPMNNLALAPAARKSLSPGQTRQHCAPFPQSITDTTSDRSTDQKKRKQPILPKNSALSSQFKH